MIKPEINEIKKLYNIKKCSVRRIVGCYVDGEKNKKTEINESFLMLPEDDMHKYFEIFKKTLSGSLGKNLLNLDFPFKEEQPGGTQEFLLRLRDSELKDPALLEEFYDKIIASYEYVGNYLILVVHDVYDVPGKTTDGITMDDASDVVYDYILACICPVNLSKAGLSYYPEENNFQNRTRDWVVDMPETGFLFPAFNDRASDIHSTLFYKKDAEAYKPEYVERLFNCVLPLSANSQKETFHSIIEETLGEDCSLEAVIDIHEKLNEMVEAHKDSSEPLVLDKIEFKYLLVESEIPDEKIDQFEEHYSEVVGEEETPIFVNNIASTRSFEVKTPDVVVKVKPEKTNLLETKEIGGRRYLMIALDGDVEVNGITLSNPNKLEEEE